MDSTIHTEANHAQRDDREIVGDRYDAQRYVAVARPSRESRLPRFRWAMVLAMNAATSSDTTMSMTMVDGPRPRMANGGPASAHPYTVNPTTTVPSVNPRGTSADCTNSFEDSSLCPKQSKKPTMTISQSSGISPSPTPLSPPACSAVAYAGPPELPPQRSGEIRRLGRGIAYYHKVDEPGWLDACGGCCRDILEHMKVLFRGPPDQFADLHSRKPIEVGVHIQKTITPIEN